MQWLRLCAYGVGLTKLELWRVENIVTLVCATSLVLGLFYLSNSWHALWGLLLLFNINYVKSSR